MDFKDDFYIMCGGIKYLVKEYNVSEVMLHWFDESGEKQFIDYTKAQVVSHLESGAWTLCEEELPETKQPIKSTGGSSSYYDIKLPKHVVDAIIERNEDGCAYIKSEEIIEAKGNDFDLGNIDKCSTRIASLMNGCGKEGNDVIYDANKIIYYANRLIQREKNKVK